jgi:quercetin dioxygenase-like cupin family protein
VKVLPLQVLLSHSSLLSRRSYTPLPRAVLPSMRFESESASSLIPNVALSLVSMGYLLLIAASTLLAVQAAVAQDPVKVDAKHYKVEFENEQVRVLRIKYGPGEKSVMHDHPDSTTVFSTEHHVKFSYPDGETEQVDAKAGEHFGLRAGSTC